MYSNNNSNDNNNNSSSSNNNENNNNSAVYIYIKKGVGWIPLFYHCVVYLKVHLGPSVIIL